MRKINFKNRIYHHLVITAKDPNTDIYVADTEGNLVFKATGKADEGLIPDFYDIHFGIHGKRRRINLTASLEIEE
jgi:hypothetical protein